MRIDEFIRRTEALVAVIASDETRRRVSIAALNRLAGLHKRRIFTDGRATAGGDIGRYSKKPYYANSRPKLLPKSKLKPLGKNKKSKFKNGQKKKSRYLPGGYAEFRDRVGRQNNKVDLNLTSSTVGSLAVGRRGGKFTYGYTNRRSALIMKSNERRFGKLIAAPTDDEVREAGAAAVREWTQILKELYNVE